ncbi:hypothetical protein FRB90_007592, partial [Tulasnella sp. 427]
MASLLVSRSLRFAATRASPALRTLATQAPPPPPPPAGPSSSSKAPKDAPQPNPSNEASSSAQPQQQQPSKAISLDFDPASDPLKTGRTGARSAKDSLSSIERRRKYLTRVTL